MCVREEKGGGWWAILEFVFGGNFVLFVLVGSVCVCVRFLEIIVIAQEVPVEPHALGSSFPPHSPHLCISLYMDIPTQAQFVRLATSQDFGFRAL